MQAQVAKFETQCLSGDSQDASGFMLAPASHIDHGIRVGAYELWEKRVAHKARIMQANPFRMIFRLLAEEEIHKRAN